MKTTKEMIEVMQAYEEGKKIVCFDMYGIKKCVYYNKTDSKEPSWNWFDNDYLVCEEPSKPRMTNRQLAEWLAKGNGEYTDKQAISAYCNFVHSIIFEDNCVVEDLYIRSWDSAVWVEPTVDIYERDCKGKKE